MSFWLFSIINWNDKVVLAVPDSFMNTWLLGHHPASSLTWINRARTSRNNVNTSLNSDGVDIFVMEQTVTIILQIREDRMSWRHWCEQRKLTKQVDVRKPLLIYISNKCRCIYLQSCLCPSDKVFTFLFALLLVSTISCEEYWAP